MIPFVSPSTMAFINLERRFIWDPGGNGSMLMKITVSRPPVLLHAIGSMLPYDRFTIYDCFTLPAGKSSLCDALTSVTMVSCSCWTAPLDFDVVYTRRMAAATSVRGVWDPGIRAAAIGVPADLFPHDVNTTTASRAPFLLITYTHPTLLRPTKANLFAGTATRRASLFHYSHPVLSRPTVPNIDS